MKQPVGMVNPPNHDVLDMLNTKYILTTDKSNAVNMVANPTACGHAWFVKSIKLVNNANQEMQGDQQFCAKG